MSAGISYQSVGELCDSAREDGRREGAAAERERIRKGIEAVPVYGTPEGLAITAGEMRQLILAVVIDEPVTTE